MCECGGCWKQRIGVLEDLCRRKDSVIFDLKQDILALESKVYSVLQVASLTISNAYTEREREREREREQAARYIVLQNPCTEMWHCIIFLLASL
jgi:hypothetical protein